jgi:Uma2 family endonuclease
MDWQQVINEPSLQNLPFKIETDERGRIIMSAHRIGHSVFQGEIAFMLRMQGQNGVALSECAINTRKGTKVADVAWTTNETLAVIRNEVAASIAPELCVEVLSMSNSEEEMVEKRELYFERGAKEVWICDEYGDVRFYNQTGQIQTSGLFPNFPNKIVI